jgi:hypothetical protein
LAAIQGLQKKFETETGSLRAELKARDAEIADLRQQLAHLTRFLGDRQNTETISR